MAKARREDLASSLRRHYAAQRGGTSSADLEQLAQAMLAEDARSRQAHGSQLSLPAFVAGQARYLPAWTWLAQLTLVVLMGAVAHHSEGTLAAKLAVGAFSAATVLVGVPTMCASKRNGMAELEYACVHNTANVLVARLVVLGCSSALAMAVMIGITAASINVGIFQVALWACLPFFCSCAGVLALMRHASPESATALSVVWVAGCLAALMAAGKFFPQVYDGASLVVWMAAAVAALLWLARELQGTMREAAAGLDAFCPQLITVKS